MTRDRGEWQYLLNYKSVEERVGLDRNDCLDDADLLINDMRVRLDDLMMLLAVEGQKEADMYWRMSEGHRDEKPDAEECRIGTRVRVVGVSLVLEWYRNRFVDNGEGNKKKVFSTHIKKGLGYSYSMSRFKREPMWAKYIIKAVEDRYAVIRKRANTLGKIRNALNEYERQLKKERIKKDVP